MTSSHFHIDVGIILKKMLPVSKDHIAYICKDNDTCNLFFVGRGGGSTCCIQVVAHDDPTATCKNSIEDFVAYLSICFLCIGRFPTFLPRAAPLTGTMPTMIRLLPARIPPKIFFGYSSICSVCCGCSPTLLSRAPGALSAPPAGPLWGPGPTMCPTVGPGAQI